MAADKVCATPCYNCDRKGLPILFTRYAVAYSAQSANMAALKQLSPMGQLEPKPGGVDMHTALYNVRMLRAGYLYVHIDRGLPNLCTGDEWKGYVVHPHGYLNEFDVFLPGEATPKVACARDARQANNSMVWVRMPEGVKKLWYLFNPDPIDYEHLMNVIAPNPDKYMQSFDVAGWANGNTKQKNTVQPGLLNGQVVEFAALGNDVVANACEPLLYGLMGSNAIERGWGDYETSEEVTRWNSNIMGDPTPEVVTVTKSHNGPSYMAAHGTRLKQMANFLQQNKGAVVACDDALGIAQELGHLQAEAQTDYTRWQLRQADGAATGVTNEWVYQTALCAQRLHNLIKQGAVSATEKRIKDWDKMLDQMDQSGALLSRRNPEVAKRNAEVRAQARINQQKERDAAKTAGDTEFNEYFDAASAKKILDSQKEEFGKCTSKLAELGTDQVAWLKSNKLKLALGLYSGKDEKLNQHGGGGALALHLVAAMVGTEANSVGQNWLKEQSLFGDNPLAWALSFNSKTIQKLLDEVAKRAEQETLPAAQGGAWTETLTLKVLKPYAARFALGDKAIAFAKDPKLKSLCDAGIVRKSAWALNLGSLMSVKMMQGVNGLPVTKVEAQVVKYVAMTGLSTLGTKAQEAVAKLTAAEQKRRVSAGRKVAAAAQGVHTAHAVPEVRAAALGATFDLALALVKGAQMGINPDQRTGVEMIGNVLQAVGSFADFRAQAYSETIFKGITGADLYKMKAYKDATSDVQVLALKGMRLTAFKFLLPAAMIGMYWDWQDGGQSAGRGNVNLAIAQYASVAGAAFTISATLAGIASIGGEATMMLSAATWGTIACALGLVGAVVTLGAVIGMWIFYVPKWKEWLQDMPLNKKNTGKKPGFENLQETLQKLANAIAAAGLETDAVGIPG